MAYEQLHVLLADQSTDRLEQIEGLVDRLGHTVVARSVEPSLIGPLSRESRADLALVAFGRAVTDALELVRAVVREAACPVIALLDSSDNEQITAAAQCGVFAYATLDGGPNELEAAIDVTLRRFAEFSNLEGAFGRRATIEQAKGIVMARNLVDADGAFRMLRLRSQQSGKKLIDVAEAVIASHTLLPQHNPEERRERHA